MVSVFLECLSCGTKHNCACESVPSLYITLVPNFEAHNFFYFVEYPQTSKNKLANFPCTLVGSWEPSDQ